jgi:hypothetical protein
MVPMLIWTLLISFIMSASMRLERCRAMRGPGGDPPGDEPRVIKEKAPRV